MTLLDPVIWVRLGGTDHAVWRWRGGFPIETHCHRSITPGWGLARDAGTPCRVCVARLSSAPRPGESDPSPT